MPLSKDDPALDYDGSWDDASKNWPSINFNSDDEAKQGYVVAWRQCKIPYGSYVLVGKQLRLEAEHYKARVLKELITYYRCIAEDQNVNKKEVFTLTIKLGNESMQSRKDIARVLRIVAQKLENSPQDFDGVIMDLNGNRVGSWGLD